MLFLRPILTMVLSFGLSLAIRAQAETSSRLGGTKETPSCASELMSHTEGHLSGWSAAIESTTLENPQTSLLPLSKSLGFQPILKFETHRNEDTLVLYYPDGKTYFARLDFILDGEKIEINLVLIAPLLRKQGVSYFLMSELIARYPEVNVLEFRLSEDNLKAFQRASRVILKEKRLSPNELCIEAMRTTPAYKSIQSHGFTLIEKCDPEKMSADGLRLVDSPALTVRRGI